jgi:thioredoxin 1
MRSLATALFAFLSMVVTSVSFSAEMPFDQPQVAAMRDGGKPFVVAFHNESCLMCPVQSIVLRDTLQSPDFMGITLFTVHFDTEKLLERSLGITKQSAMVAFKDDKETAHAAGVTHYDSLTGIVRHAVVSPNVPLILFDIEPRPASAAGSESGVYYAWHG